MFAKGLDGTLVRRRGRQHAVNIVGARLAISGALRAPAVSFVRRPPLYLLCALSLLVSRWPVESGKLAR